jgi:hypothetical protein
MLSRALTGDLKAGNKNLIIGNGATPLMLRPFRASSTVSSTKASSAGH